MADNFKWWVSGPDDAIVGVAFPGAAGPTQREQEAATACAAHEVLGRRVIDWTSGHTDRCEVVSVDAVQIDPEGDLTCVFYNFK